MLTLTVQWPWATSLLRFGPLHANDLAVTVGSGLVLLFVLVAHGSDRELR